jgi:hypothetical protein
MIAITDEQRHVLVEHALCCNWSFGLGRQGEEARFADVIADLAMDRAVGDRDLLVRFLWERVARALHAGLSRSDHLAWSAAVELLDQLGEDLDNIFSAPATPRVHHKQSRSAAQANMNTVSVHGLLEVLANFDEHGGASSGLVAWELYVDEQNILAAWELALTEGWLTPAGRDLAYNEQLYRLTLSGWVAAREHSPEVKSGPEAAEELL